MKVALLGMKGEFDDLGSISGINKYMSYVYHEMCKMKGMEVTKVEYGKVAKKLPWANHAAFYIQSEFSDFRGYDIIHNPNGLRLFKKPKNSRLVTTIHDLMPVTNRERNLGGSVKEVLVSVNSRFSDYVATEGFKLALKSDHIIVDIDYGKEELLEHFDYDKDKISTVRLAMDYKFLEAQPRNAKQQRAKFKVGYVGSFNAPKNIDFAIRAMKMIDDREIIMELWGKKTLEAEVLEKSSGNDERIRFMGVAPEGQKVQIFDSFDVFVHPGVYESIIQFEALSRGLPVIVKKGSKLSPDLLEHCIEAKDEPHMAQIIKDLKLNGYDNAKRKKSMEYARGFTWKRLTEDTVNVYKKVLG
ncbi:MAG: glycosyltransferase [Candidatus Micrarchaeota archaeon]|nr:glycosyltransferase [Candidatus Micrarchaeota archaeon]